MGGASQSVSCAFGSTYRGKADVVDGVDQQGVEGVQGLVQVVHLDDDGADQSEQQDPGEGVAHHRRVGAHWERRDGGEGKVSIHQLKTSHFFPPLLIN